jgi:prepilin-type N-terminal cleavage/methylation domain-containing protein
MIRTHRNAFTMIELVFVIVILGIVASIGSQLIVQTYESYVQQRAIHRTGIKTELAITQLANRLTYRISNSMVARKPGHTGNTIPTDFYPATDVPIGEVDNYPILEWISYDFDARNAYMRPAWSGYCDVNASTYNRLITPGSTLTKVPLIATYYTGGDDPAIIFAGDADYKTGSSYSPTCMYTSGGCLFPMTINVGNEGMKFNGGDRTKGQMIYTEIYYLATTAFAVVPTNKHQIDGHDVWDLRLYYGYQPWKGENYTQGRSSTLLRNVSVMRYSKEANSIRIKLCSVEKTAIGGSISLCKEKAVIR